MIFSYGQVGIPAGIFKPSPPAHPFISWLDERLDMEKNIEDFLSDTSDLVSKLERKKFIDQVNMNLMFFDQIESPIEQMFFIAFMGYTKLYDVNLIPISNDHVSGQRDFNTVFITPQKVIGSYKVDFLLSHIDINDTHIDLIVELDGHDFHDKNKEQRAYEKSRDRYFSRNGYKTLHFTGSEVFNHPFKVVLECLSQLTVSSEDMLFDYNPSDPFMLGIV